MLRESDRLMTLTAALHDAVDREAWEELSDLFESRQNLLDSMKTISKQDLTPIAESNARLVERIALAQRSVSLELRNLGKSRNVKSAYSNGAVACFNRAAA